MSVMATLATGVLAGPAGSGIISSGNVSQFFSELSNWYGNDPDQTAPVATYNDHGNPVASCPPPASSTSTPSADQLRGLQRLRALGAVGPAGRPARLRSRSTACKR